MKRLVRLLKSDVFTWVVLAVLFGLYGYGITLAVDSVLGTPDGSPRTFVVEKRSTGEEVLQFTVVKRGE